jgi:cell division protein FtsZ
MIAKGLSGVEFIAANTDVQALHNNLAPIKVQLGKMSTRGLGAGADPAVGYKAVEESAEEIKQALAGADMVFVTAGMGGGTGTGAAPFVAKIARELGALVVGIVTKPFKWEAAKRAAVAERGTEELRRHVDALIVIPNQRLMSVIDKHTSFREAFQRVDEVLNNATRGISDIISGTGYINVDFADVRTIMKNTGDALMGTGIAKGEHRAVEAAQAAISSPLLDGVSIQGAQGVLVNVTGSSDMTMFEIGDAVSIIEQAAGSDVNLIHGIVFDDSMGDSVMVTVVATGFGASASQASTAAATVVTPSKPEAEPQQTVVETHAEPKSAHGTLQPSTTNQQYATTTATTTKRPLPASSPSGLQELQKYDEPAFQRRLGISSIKINKFDTDTTEELPKDDQLTKPAFLRRIMD